MSQKQYLQKVSCYRCVYVCVLAPTIFCSSDIVFVVDTSGSITVNDFNFMKSFLSQLVSRLDIGNGTTRVGLVTYATTVNTIFYLNFYSSVYSVKSAIAQLSHTSGGTNTAAALAHVRMSMLTSATGDRSNVTNVVIVLTDGRSSNTTATQVCRIPQSCRCKRISTFHHHYHHLLIEHSSVGIVASRRSVFHSCCLGPVFTCLLLARACTCPTADLRCTF